MLNVESIYRILASALGLSPSSAEARQMIRAAYQEDIAFPEPGRQENTVYYHLAPDPYTRAGPEETAAQIPSGPAGQLPLLQGEPFTVLFRYVPYTLSLTFYGPDAGANALAVRSGLFRDGPGNPLRLLRAEGAYPVPEPPMPLLLYEPEAGSFRARADLKLPLRIAQETRGSGSSMITAAPRLAIYTNAEPSP